MNCAAPDTGNMEILHMFGCRSSRSAGSSRCPGEHPLGVLHDRAAVASSDARNICASIVRDGDEYVINGRKWWSPGPATRAASCWWSWA